MNACCACGNASKALAFKGDGFELVRGHAYIGGGKWLCVACTHTANAEFARAVAAYHAKRDAPPEGFA